MSRPSMKSPNVRRRNTAAFTVIELLACVAVLAIIAMLIAPVVTKTRETANSARCLANLKQIFAGMQGFANDNQGQIVRWIDQSGKAISADQRYDTFWWEKLEGYVPGPLESKIWKCPSNREGLYRIGESGKYTDPANVLTSSFSYAINAVGRNSSKDGLPGPSMVYTPTPPYERQRIQSLPSPSTTIAVCDGKSWLIFESNGSQKATAAGRHDGGMNAVFWDGHAELFPTVLSNDDRLFSVSID